ncbi:endoglucanase [Fibrobacterales bacterium]|nr:endoglucanase [Fibrobacterales bacterium]
MNFTSLLLVAIMVTAAFAQNHGTQIGGFGSNLNQLGFGEKAKKVLVYKGIETADVEIRDLTTEKTVLTAKLSDAEVWEFSGESVRKADFSGLNKAGVYAAYLGGRRISDNIVVNNNVYKDLFEASLKWFYYQRSSTALPSQYAGKWARAAGHPDTKVSFYPPSEKPENWTISSPKGWYDAGDYGKYIVNSGISVFTILELYEHFPNALKKFSLNIPESKSKTPDILEEVRWNLDWMLTMQDSDGGVYHKLTTVRFSGHDMPETDLAERVVVMKTTAATLNFAAILAQASRIYKPFDAAFSQKALAAAEKAFDWSRKNPVILFKQPDGMNTGQYNPGDETAKDETLWAATELYAATKKKEYLDVVSSIPFTSNSPWWGDVNFLAVYRMAGLGGTVSKAARDTLLGLANFIAETTEKSPYELPVMKWNFVWGSNSAVANNGIVLLHAYYLTKNVKYLNAAQRALDYLLGANPLSMSFVTGYGNRTPAFPHHRPSEGDEITDPVPGMLVGGPHEGGQDIKPNGRCDDYLQKGKPALCYVDDVCSYATNEVAINWNAPLVYLSGALHFLNLGEFP